MIDDSVKCKYCDSSMNFIKCDDYPDHEDGNNYAYNLYICNKCWSVYRESSLCDEWLQPIIK